MTGLEWQKVRYAIQLLATIGATAATSCFAFAPPPPVPAMLLGCYEMALHGVPASIADSLGYDVPTVLELNGVEIGPGSYRVMPTDPDDRPSWGYAVRDQEYSVRVIFPGWLGSLLLRVARAGASTLTGRAEWSPRHGSSGPSPIHGSFVELQRADCSRVERDLR